MGTERVLLLNFQIFVQNLLFADEGVQNRIMGEMHPMSENGGKIWIHAQRAHLFRTQRLNYNSFLPVFSADCDKIQV